MRNLRIRLVVSLAIALIAGCTQVQGPAVTQTKNGPVEFAGPGGVKLTGELFLPAAAAGRHPAVVLMHGCGGMNTPRGQLVPRHRAWAERFAEWGYVALLVDSFSARGVKSLCTMENRPIQPWTDRTADAYAALDVLAARPDVDPQAVFALGWSHGGSTVLGVVRPQAPGMRLAGPRFRGAIAFYPGCDFAARSASYRSTMPLAILHGEADDWTPVGPCIALGKQLNGTGQPVRVKTYPGAPHGFDAPGPLGTQYLPDVFNPRAPGGRGAHIGTHPEARDRAIAEVKAFVDELLKK